MTEEKYNSKKYNSKKYIKPEVKLDENHFEIDEAWEKRKYGNGNSCGCRATRHRKSKQTLL